MGDRLVWLDHGAVLSTGLVECDRHLGEVVHSEGGQEVVSGGEEDTVGGVVQADHDPQEPRPVVLVPDAQLEGVHLLYL